MPSLYQFTVETIAGDGPSLQEFQGQVLLVVNTASRCGSAPQYQGPQALYDKFHAKGFNILAFPCN